MANKLKQILNRIRDEINPPEANLTPSQKRHNIICTIAGVLAAIGMIFWVRWVMDAVMSGDKEGSKKEPSYTINQIDDRRVNDVIELMEKSKSLKANGDGQ